MGEIEIVRLDGDNYQIGKLYANILKDRYEDSALPFFINVPDYFYRRMEESLPALMRKIVKKGIEKFVYKPMIKRLHKDIKELVKGIKSEIDGLDENLLYRAFIFTDAYSYLLGYLYRTLGLGLPPIAACSSFSVWDKATKNGRMLTGRNFDFWGGIPWSKYHTIFYIEPRKGIPFVSIASRGILLFGITAMNKEGLTIAPHFHFTKDINKKGDSIIYMTSEIISKAKNIIEAIDIARKFSPAVGWTFFISSARDKKAIAIEISANKMKINDQQTDYLAHSNIYTTWELKKDEFVPGYSWYEHNRSRLYRLYDFIHKNYGKIDEKKAIALLGDHFDITVGKERAFGNTITAIHNASSVLFVPEELRFYVATGSPPASNSEYVEFYFEELVPKRKVANNSFVKKKNKFRALKKYVELNYLVELGDLDYEKLLSMVKEAVDLDKEEPLYKIVYALFLIKKGAYKEAISQLEASHNENYNTVYREGFIWFWQGRANDLLGNRKEAIRCYKKVLYILPRNEYNMRRLARKNLKKPYSFKDIKKFEIDTMVVDTYEV